MADQHKQTEEASPVEAPSVMHEFECSTCCLDIAQAQEPKVVDGSYICRDCIVTGIVPQFQAALESELDYPPNWGPISLQVNEFRSELGEVFFQRYVNREKEYRIPAADRISCRHRLFTLPPKGEWTGTELALDDNYLQNMMEIEGDPRTVECDGVVDTKSVPSLLHPTCERCLGLICRRCEGPMSHDYESHRCTTDSARKVLDATPDEHGLKRGTDYQLCPKTNCRYPIALRDGCNTLICPMAACRTHFCFLCGVEAHHDSDHFRTSCPRWGHPTNQRTSYDPPAIKRTKLTYLGHEKWICREPVTQQEIEYRHRMRRTWLREIEERSHLMVTRGWDGHDPIAFDLLARCMDKALTAIEETRENISFGPDEWAAISRSTASSYSLIEEFMSIEQLADEIRYRLPMLWAGLLILRASQEQWEHEMSSEFRLDHLIGIAVTEAWRPESPKVVFKKSSSW